jgi:transcriptional regulator with XRE-family HTH domain
MKTPQLGQEIRRLRLEAGITLRRLAAKLEVSAAHLSDIEHNRRRPSEKLLRLISRELSAVGATFDALEVLLTGIDPDTRDWVASTPGVRKLLRAVKESGQHPHDVLRALEKVVAPKKKSRKRPAR